MDQNKAAGIIEAYDALRERCFELARENGGALMGDDQWLRNALCVGDMLIQANADGVNCWGLTFTSQTQSSESFDFTIPYNLLEN
jgi:hypothetical protein